MRLFGFLAAIVCTAAWLRGQGTSAGSPADPERILAGLKPDQVTRQVLWLVSGRKVQAQPGDPYAQLVGHYWFDAYTVSPPGSEPGPAFPLCIKALIPYQRDQDEDPLEMQARFAFTGAGVWLLDRVQSRFRREGSGSAGTVTSLPTGSVDNTALRELEELARRTEAAVQAVNQAPIGVRKQMVSGGWLDFPLQAAWAGGLSPAGEKDEQASRARIGVLRAQLGAIDGRRNCLSPFLTGA